MSTTTAILIVNAALMFGIVAAIVSLCAGAILTSPAVERRHRQPRRRTASTPRRAATGTFVRRASYES